MTEAPDGQPFPPGEMDDLNPHRQLGRTRLQPIDNHSQQNIFSVSRLTEEIKQLLEESYPFIWISGEISNLRIPSSGHAYFTLKDDRAQIAAVMFAGQLKRLPFDLEDGITLLALGRVTVYRPRGVYQIILEHARPEGAGALQIAFEQLKRKLENEGLFDARHKSKLPLLPQKVALVTSSTGAAVQDMLNVAARRYPNLHLLIIPVRVQGDRAADEICAALANANALSTDRPDVIIIARGGGSLEDLAAYNSETVARAIFKSRIPVVSAVGHETDYTIADFVADLRAPTPSAAAELVVPVKKELKNRCMEYGRQCRRAMDRLLQGKRDHLYGLQHAMVHPLRRVQELQQRIDELNHRARRAVLSRFETSNHLYEKRLNGLLFNKPDRHIIKFKARVALLESQLLQLIKSRYARDREHLLVLGAGLRALNPQAILKRGYSITRTLPQKDIVTNAAGLSQGQPLEVQLFKGRIEVTVHRTPLTKPSSP
jgi:exodeoxyribonuclease VII large subunit